MAKKKKAKKPKVKISKRKALILAVAIFGICALFLALSVALSSPKKPKFVEPEKPPVTIEPPKFETPKTPPTQKPEPKPVETPKDKSKDKQKDKKKPAEKEKPKDKESPKPVVPSAPAPKEPSPTPTPRPTEPKPTPEPQKPVSKYNFPPAVNNAKLVFLFDDGGQNLFELQKFLELPMPITVAVLPKLQYSAESGRRIVAAGKQLIMHQPMQAINPAVNPGPGAITPEMSISEINQLLAENVASIGKVAGMNNHEGSKISENQIQIGAVLDFCDANKMFYLDSRTTNQTRAPQAAMERGIDIYERNGFFLDNEKTEEEFLTQLRKNLDIANKTGSVIMIAHIWSADYLPALIMKVYPELVEKGYHFGFIR